MALTREQKEQTVSEVKELLKQAKIVVFAQYSGVDVQSFQHLRTLAEQQQAAIKVAKNRLVKLALRDTPGFKDADSDMLGGQLLYAFSSEDEVVPAQILANFAKQHKELELMGAIDATGTVFDQEQVRTLSELPSQEALQAKLVAVIAAPLSGLHAVLSGNLRGIVNVLKAKAETSN